MGFKELIKERRKELGLTLEEVANACNVTKATVMRWENGSIVNIKKDKIYPLANVLKLNPFSLLDFDSASELLSKSINKHILKSPDITEDVVTFPVIGEIAAGYDEIAVEDWSGDTVDIPTSYLKGRKKEDFFVLSVHGDSMYPMYLNGDKVLILKQNTLDHSGDVGAILYEGECATLKKVEYVQGEDWLRLVPINPEYQPKLIEGADLELCRVIGVPRLLVREID